MSKISDLLYTLPNIFIKERAKGWDRCIVFDLDGEEPIKVTATVIKQELKLHDGDPTPEEAALKTLVINGCSEDVYSMFNGEVPPMNLVNAKKVRMVGGVTDSMSFSRIWNIQKKY